VLRFSGRVDDSTHVLNATRLPHSVFFGFTYLLYCTVILAYCP